MPPSSTPKPDLCHDIRSLTARVERLEDALPRNDLGKPDYDWLREYSSERKESATQMRGYQQEVTKNLLRATATLIIMTFGAGYSEHLLAFFKAFVP